MYLCKGSEYLFCHYSKINQLSSHCTSLSCVKTLCTWVVKEITLLTFINRIVILFFAVSSATSRLLRLCVRCLHQHASQPAPPHQMCHQSRSGRVLSERRSTAGSAVSHEEIPTAGAWGDSVLTERLLFIKFNYSMGWISNVQTVQSECAAGWSWHQQVYLLYFCHANHSQWLLSGL